MNLSKSTRKKGIYLLPNLFTTGAMFAGYYSIIASINGKYETAAIFIFIAALLDGLDGRVARLTNTQSDFGVQYDSLSDLVSFGLAPSILMFTWALQSLGDIHPVMGKIGWLASFIYAVSAALRLARFNVQVEVLDKAYFQGLPSPAAAGLLASFVWAAEDLGLSTHDLRFVALPLTVITGLLMVSRFRYYSFKTLPIKERVSFGWILLLVGIFVLLALDPPKVLFVTAFSYALSGPVLTLVQLRRTRQAKNREKSHKKNGDRTAHKTASGDPGPEDEPES